MSISSLGVGSGLDVNSIVTQLVAIEKQPLQTLQTKASTLQSQLSAYGTIKSQLSTLEDAATVLSDASNWSAQKATSSDASITATAAATASAGSFSLEVTQLARVQTSASKTLSASATLGVAGDTGSLTFELGSWATGSFVSGGASPVTVSGINGDDSLATIAGKINAASAGVKATVLNSGTQQRLVFTSSTTGAEAGFKITTEITSEISPGVPTDFAGLASLSFTSLTTPAQSSQGMQLGQTGLNASVKINGVSAESATNTLTDVVPGLTFQLSQVSTTPALITVSSDQDQIQKNIQSFVDAYNAVAKTLTADTKYVTGGVSGILQGDSTTVNLQTVLRRITSSISTGSTFSRLTDVGLEQQTDGTLSISSKLGSDGKTKLARAMADMSNLQKLFTTNTSNSASNGFGLKFKDFTHGMLAFDGTITNKSTAIQGAITRNGTEQTRVNDRASRVEKQLRQQYSALDVKMAQMNSLSSYVTAQLAQWNKTGA